MTACEAKIMNARILVVEDEKAIRLALCGLLRRSGYEVEVAEDGESAVPRLAEEVYDLDTREATCPRDGKTLTRVRSGKSPDTTIERCPECQGLWLDGGELRRMRGG